MYGHRILSPLRSAAIGSDTKEKKSGEMHAYFILFLLKFSPRATCVLPDAMLRLTAVVALCAALVAGGGCDDDVALCADDETARPFAPVAGAGGCGVLWFYACSSVRRSRPSNPRRSTAIGRATLRRSRRPARGRGSARERGGGQFDPRTTFFNPRRP